MYRIFFLMAIFITASSHAASDRAEIRFRGELAYNPCIIKTENVQIDFGMLTDSSFDSSGHTAWEKFSLIFEKCPVGLRSVDATFFGEPSLDFPERSYENAGTAKNVTIQLDSEDAGYGLGNGRGYAVPIENGMAEMRLVTRIKQKEKKFFTPGTIEGVVAVSLTYR